MRLAAKAPAVRAMRLLLAADLDPLRCSLPHSRPRHTPSAVAAKAPALAHKQSSGSTEGVQEGADDVTALLVARLLYVPAIARVDLRCD